MVTVKAHCDDCEHPQTVTPTGKRKRDGWSAEYWRVVEHRDPRDGQFCPGSGKLV